MFFNNTQDVKSSVSRRKFTFVSRDKDMVELHRGISEELINREEKV